MSSSIQHKPPNTYSSATWKEMATLATDIVNENANATSEKDLKDRIAAIAKRAGKDVTDDHIFNQVKGHVSRRVCGRHVTPNSDAFKGLNL